MCMRIKTSNKNFILKYFRCRDGKRTETRIGMEGICITHSLYTVYMQHNGSQWWNAGMGNTDTLHPNSCFCSFSIPTSENKIFVTSLYSFYAHAHETTPTSGYKLVECRNG